MKDAVLAEQKTTRAGGMNGAPERTRKLGRGALSGGRKSGTEPAGSPRRHLAGLYLDGVLCEMLETVGKASDPMTALQRFIRGLPPNFQRDLLCSFIREFRKQITSTAIREIADHL